MAKIDQRLAELDIQLPAPGTPAGNYVPFVITDKLVYISGQVPRADGKVVFRGKLGAELDVTAGQAAARLCAINVLTQLKAACDGNLDLVKRCVRLGGFVNSSPKFTDQPAVINGASDLITAVFGEAGRHARTAVGVAALPADSAVEVDAIFELK
jgi:enamine deaminase RidA (YjgF/YER057c/UK114 family)